MSKPKTVTKQEALELLSAQLRKPNLDSDLMVKVMGTYAKLQGWGKEPDEPQAEPDLDELILQLEKKRKAACLK